MSITAIVNSSEVARFVDTAIGRNYPAEILEAAKMCLVDWCGVAIGACNEDAAKTVRTVATNWGTKGDAQVLLGGKTAPSAAAMINGTMAHCLDYDDTHMGSTTHISGPTIASALAVGTHLELNEREILSAIITGFEVAARLGKGAGQPANLRGFHATGIFGAFGATAAASVLYQLDENSIKNAFGAVATQTGGLSASFGTMSKPFHAGKAALNGVLSAELAAEGFISKEDLIEPKGGLSTALYQDGASSISQVDFSDSWEILQNTFKPYAACLLTHALIDAARSLSEEVKDRNIAKVEAIVSESANKLAGNINPQTPLEGKFSLAYCAALGLKGYEATEADFSSERVADPEIQDILKKVEAKPTKGMAETAARIVVELADGSRLNADIPLSLGNPDNPLDWEDIWRKFEPLVKPSLGIYTGDLYGLLRNFEEPGALVKFIELVSND